MKKMMILMIVMGISRVAGAQSSYEYTRAIYDKIIAMDKEVKKSYGDSMTIRRIETGILAQSGSSLQSSIERMLFTGNRYIFYVFTDKRCRDLKMNVYSTAGDKWTPRQTTDKNEKKTSSSDDLYGDYEIMSITPDTSQDYKIEIVAPAGDAAAARFGMMIWSKDVKAADQTQSQPQTPQTTTGTGSVYYSINSTKTCYWNAGTKAYENCKDADQSSLFVFNANKTVFTHTTDNLTSKYYVQSNQYNTENKLTQYEVVSDAGNKYTFMVPDDANSIVVVNVAADPAYYIKFIVRRKWTE